MDEEEFSPQSVRDFFPGVTTFGLRELALQEEDSLILEWIMESTRPGFDALDPRWRATFVQNGRMLLSELLAGVVAIRRIASKQPTDVATQTISTLLLEVLPSAKDDLWPGREIPMEPEAVMACISAIGLGAVSTPVQI